MKKDEREKFDEWYEIKKAKHLSLNRKCTNIAIVTSIYSEEDV